MPLDSPLPLTPAAPTAGPVPRQILLRRAAGYLELGELLVEPDAATPAPAVRLLERCLEEIRQLPDEVRQGPLASLIEGEALRAMGAWADALVPLGRATAIAEEIASRSPDAVRAAKRLLNRLAVADAADQFAAERDEIHRLIGSPNQAEAVTSYFEKRPPRFVDPA